MLIAFEGIDGSGKSELSTRFCQYLNDTGYLKEEFIWVKEPEFTSEEADILNRLHESKDVNKREVMFLSSRLKNQKNINGKNIVCDRYIWSALAYTQVLSPSVYEFLREVYLNEDLFIRPDLYIFVDTNPVQCSMRGVVQNSHLLVAFRESYLSTIPLIKSPYLFIKSEDAPGLSQEESIQLSLKNIIEKFSGFRKDK